MKEISLETRKKLSKVTKEYWDNHPERRIFSEDHKKNIKVSRIGKHHTEEWKNNMSKRMFGKNNPMYNKKAEENGWYGKHHTEKTKQILRDNAINKSKYRNGSRVFVGKNETKILDILEEIYEYKIIRQYQINNYFVDGYIEELNLVIEVDERNHNKFYQKIKDIKKESEIIKILGCKFLRIEDRY